MPFAEIEWGKLGELLWAAPIASLAVSIVFALVIVGAARASEARREGALGLAAAFTAMTAVAFLGFAGCVVFGIYVITA
ncbi:hypothetical protein [Conexibacter sp. SYSU D00693]|uniref:hypothetical protein n=1 Tax=Conexibacter sp. SYSU D00693 TaxID=2812560 RepID=UPI00196ABBDF|nr:hypothetical protein [Conexibacter sp. SYSU D00693]